MPGRHGTSLKPGYRYGYQGQEKDDDLKGEGNSMNYTFRMHDTRVGRFFATDPLEKSYPFYSPYAFSGNRVIDAVELEGKEPKIIVTDEVTGYTYIKVYGAGNVQLMVVETYKAIIQYTDSKGNVTETGTYNVTRDGWFDMGTDPEGKVILYNRSSDPSNSKSKIFIQSQKEEQYGEGTPTFTMSPIKSPILEEYNKTFFDNGIPSEALDPAVIRQNNTANGAQFHVGGFYTDIYGEEQIGGTYGCYGVVDPSQVFPDATNMPTANMNESNQEMINFGKSVKQSRDLQVKEHKIDIKPEVEIEPRTKETIKKI